jgi:hypothetical protein
MGAGAAGILNHDSRTGARRRQSRFVTRFVGLALPVVWVIVVRIT